MFVSCRQLSIHTHTRTHTFKLIFLRLFLDGEDKPSTFRVLRLSRFELCPFETADKNIQVIFFSHSSALIWKTDTESWLLSSRISRWRNIHEVLLKLCLFCVPSCSVWDGLRMGQRGLSEVPMELSHNLAWHWTEHFTGFDWKWFHGSSIKQHRREQSAVSGRILRNITSIHPSHMWLRMCILPEHNT